MEAEILKNAWQASPIIALAVIPVMLTIRWCLNFLREERASDGAKVTALASEINKLGTTVAEFCGWVRALREDK